MKIFGRTFKDLNLRNNDYDLELFSIAREIESVFKDKLSSNKGRVEQVRVKQWVKRLCDENVYRCLENESLMRNRNTYARLLFQSIVILGKLEGPFRKLPPQIGEELPIMPAHEVKKLESTFESHTRI